MTAENLSRTLKTLETDGVKVDGARVIITDRARLAAVARRDPLIDGPPQGRNSPGDSMPALRPET